MQAIQIFQGREIKKHPAGKKMNPHHKETMLRIQRRQEEPSRKRETQGNQEGENSIDYGGGKNNKRRF